MFGHTQRPRSRPLDERDALSSRRWCRWSKSSPAFSLMELMIVLLILSLTIGLVMPRVGSGWRKLEDREFLQEFVSTLKRARILAMNSGEIVSFRIRGSERLFDLQSPPQRPIPDNVDVFADHLPVDPDTQDRLVLFYPDGSMRGNDMEIVFDQVRSYRISIHPLVGAIQCYNKAESR